MPAATGRERVLAALSSEGTDDFPVLLPYLGILLRDHWGEVTRAPWWAGASGDLEARLGVARDLLETAPIDWVAAERCAPRRWREKHEIVEEDGSVCLVNRETGERSEMRREPIGGTQTVPREVRIRTLADVERLPAVRAAERIVADGCLDYARRVVAEFGTERFVFASAAAPFWLAHAYLGFEGLMTALIENGEVLSALLDRLAAQQVEQVRACAEAGVDGVWVEDCYSSADLISGEHFRRFALPYVERVIAEAERLGLRAVYYFCGDVSDRLEDLIATRPTALSLEESKKGFRIDLAEVAEQVRGRCALLGNLDAVNVLERAGLEGLEQAMASQGAVGKRWPRFAFSLGSPVTPGTPMERVRDYIRLARGLGPAAREGGSRGVLPSHLTFRRMG